MARRAVLLIGLCGWWLPIGVATQEAPILVSPDVRPDRVVVFRLWAPKALEVQLSGDWGPPVALAKDGQGVWTVTQGPLAPDIYQYAFYVDGVRADDPSCRCTSVFGAGRGAVNRFTVAAQPPAAWEPQGRPPGTLHHERFYSRTQRRVRGALVYTPPGYDPKGSRRYPVLVLLPGSPGDETEWTNGGGAADVVFDNLIAAGQMTPAIVVMHASDVDPRSPTRRGDENLSQFEKILVDELVPLVKQRYAVRPDAGSWAIAGVSLGGEFAVYGGLKHPELFRSIGSISGSLVPGGDPEEGLPSMEQRFGAALKRIDVVRNYRLFWIGCGTSDNVCRGSRVFLQRLDDAKVPHVWREYTGAHQLPVFRRELIDLLPLLFR